MSENVCNDEEAANPFFLHGKALERHFELREALLEFHRLFNHEDQNDRASVIVGGAFPRHALGAPAHQLPCR